MSNIVIADTRNQEDKFVVDKIKQYGYRYKRHNLPFGDFALADNIFSAVDIKSSSGGIVEIARNICSSDHGRFRREILTAADWGGDITFLVANDDGITSVEQLATWQSPRYKSDVRKDGVVVHRKGDLFTTVKGETLMRAIKTICTPDRYAKGMQVRFVFCSKEEATARILRILRYQLNERAKTSEKAGDCNADN